MFWKVKHAGEFKTVKASLLKISSLNISFFTGENWAADYFTKRN